MSHIAVVSMLGGHPTAVRGERTRRVVEALSEEHTVTLLPSPASGLWDLSSRSWGRRLVDRLCRWATLDPFEFRARRALSRTRLAPDGAILIAYPFSAAYVAARRATRLGIPYVVDTGDPWVLTAPHPTAPAVARWRARRAERYLFSHAAAGVVTTRRQAAALAQLFPTLPMLIQPNGAAQGPEPATTERSADPRTIRVAHFGSLYHSRLGVRGLLQNLLDRDDAYDSIEFHQFGPADPTFREALDQLVGVRYQEHPARPWCVVQREIHQFDAAVVVGNEDPSQLPSKAISYMGLGVPRLALVGARADSELGDFARRQPGWLVVEDSTPAQEVRDFVSEAVVTHQLPPELSWASTARTIAGFCVRHLEEEAP